MIKAIIEGGLHYRFAELVELFHLHNFVRAELRFVQNIRHVRYVLALLTRIKFLFRVHLFIELEVLKLIFLVFGIVMSNSFFKLRDK